MICQVCGQRPAAFEIDVVRGGKKEKVFACAACAENALSEAEAGAFSGGTQKTPSELAKRGGEDLRCAACGTYLSEVLQTGRCGCPECYRTFREFLLPLLGNAKDVRHRGRVPESAKKAAYFARVEALAKEMDEAFRRGDNDRVKALTEEIRALKEEAKRQ